MSELKLLALDTEDLKVVSAHLQDAVGRVADIAYDRPARRFILVLNRFDWTTPAALGSAAPRQKEAFERRQSGLRFERVDAVRSLGIDRSRPDAVVSLLAVEFTEKDAPSGTITLYFSGGPQIALDVECIEAELRDLGAAWSTRRRPEHPEGSTDGA